MKIEIKEMLTYLKKKETLDQMQYTKRQKMKNKNL